MTPKIDLIRARILCPTLAASLALCPTGAHAQSGVTYIIDEIIGGGSVTGQFVTDGHGGALASSDIVSYNLLLTGTGGTTYTVTSGNSGLMLSGSDLVVNGNKLTFNYSGTDGGYMLIQASSPGFYSGQHYTCNNTNFYACAPGGSVVPGGNTDSSAIYVAMTGVQTIGTSAETVVPVYVIGNSILVLANARVGQMLVNQLQSQVLLGQNEQISCGSCGGADVTIGSLAFSNHGRIPLSRNLTVLAGASVGTYEQRSAKVRLNLGGAVALRFDPVGMGHVRPFAEVGMSGDYQKMSFERAYVSDVGSGESNARTNGYDLGVYGKIGVVDRVSPRDEAAIAVSINRLWQRVDAYAETETGNPLNATVPGGTDKLAMVSINAQYTHLFGRRFEVDVNGGVTRSFSTSSGLSAQVSGMDFKAELPAFTYYLVGGRIGYRLKKWMTIDGYVNTILAPGAIGSSTHGGFGVRLTW